MRTIKKDPRQCITRQPCFSRIRRNIGDKCMHFQYTPTVSKIKVDLGKFSVQNVQSCEVIMICHFKASFHEAISRKLIHMYSTTRLCAHTLTASFIKVTVLICTCIIINSRIIFKISRFAMDRSNANLTTNPYHASILSSRWLSSPDRSL